MEGRASRIIRSQLDFQLGRRAVAGALCGGQLNGFRHRGRRMTEDHRSPREDVIKVAVSVDIIEACALGVLNESRLPAH